MKKEIIYPAITVKRPLPPNYAEMHALKTAFIRTEEIIPPVELVELDNAYVSPFGIVHKNGFVVKESVYSMFNPNSFYLSFIKKVLFNKVQKVNGNCTVAHNSYFQNYYHWLLEAVPRLFLLKDRAHELTLILNSHSPGFIKQYVDLFKFKNIVYIPDDYLAKADHLVFPTFTSRGLAMHEPILRDMTKWLLERNNIAQNEHPEKNIFITRKNAKYRRLLNEEKVVQYLSSVGFEIVTLEDYSVKEQMQLFANAKNVIGTQGAGMANLIYATHAKLLITIIHEEHPDDAYYNQASMNGTMCYYFQCKGAGVCSFKNNDDITVEMDKFIEVVENYILK